ncbi:MAG TPA: YHS domain-containing protein [Chloroflexota bacterium]|nr:YHS domain-containing protein [Chloroflexota bacterium]
MERDPVCGVTIRPGFEAASITYQGQTYHFCSVECRDLFREKPTQYLDQATSPEPGKPV